MTARIGVVGTGWWATFNHIPTVRAGDDAEVVAICDRDPERLSEVGERFGIAARYATAAAMLAEENLDGVMVSTPHVAHAEPAVLALDAGCHVLVEKPMATNAADGRRIAAAARRAGREVLVPCGLNFTSYTARARAWAGGGKLGRIRHAVCQMGSALHDLFAGQPMLETADHMYRPPPSTWADPARAGGYGWGQMSHALAWLLYVSDLRIESVYCAVGRSPAGVDFYDAAVGRAACGATVSFSGAATVPKHVGMHTDIRIYGEEGCLFFDNERARLELRRLDGDDEIFPVTGSEAEYDGAAPVRAFAALCAGREVVNAADAENGARVTEILDAFYRSASAGAPVAVGENS